LPPETVPDLKVLQNAFAAGAPVGQLTGLPRLFTRLGEGREGKKRKGGKGGKGKKRKKGRREDGKLWKGRTP